MPVAIELVAVLFSGLLSGAPAVMQDPPVPPPVTTPPPTVPRPELPALQPLAEPVAAELSPEELQRRRDAIMTMETVLASKVMQGAQQVTREIQALQPGLGMFRTAVARARGVYLQGYGVVFTIEIPGVRPTVVNLIQDLQRERLGQPRQASPAIPTSSGSDSGGVPRVLADPDAAYVHAVKTNLIDGMIEYSKSLGLRPSEWLTLAARGDGEPFVPGEIVETKTMILRIRGSDLAEFLSDRISRAEVLKRVQVREF